MINKKGWWNAYWYNWLVRYYTKQKEYHKKQAEYALHRHNAAVEAYNSKKSNRGIQNKDDQGFYIAEENADLYANQYNTHWAEYIKYKIKLEVLLLADAEPPLPEEVHES